MRHSLSPPQPQEPIRTAIDWTAKPAPWCWIGPQFRRECETIVAGPRSIRERRVALGLTQEQLSAAAGYTVANRETPCWNAENSVSSAAARARIEAALDRLEAERDLK